MKKKFKAKTNKKMPIQIKPDFELAKKFRERLLSENKSMTEFFVEQMIKYVNGEI